ncbi:MAG TPA: ABC transporter permease [Candidatus Polarisedimenticolia bacterium]|nr:ABC transporter permease [Candidatus Polarisedimenticolia bacterium]
MKRLRAMLAFLRKDLLEEMSYRTAFVLQLGGILLTVSLWYLIANWLTLPEKNSLPDLPGVPYFAYLLVGLAFWQYLGSALNSFASKLRAEQLTGTLEAMLITPTPIPVLILSSALWDFVMTSFRVILYLGLGVVFGIQLRFDSLLAFLVILLLTILAFSGIGILSAAFILYLKRGDPINFLITSASALFGGVFLPTHALPASLAGVGRFLPITYALNGIRRSLLTGTRLPELMPEVTALVIFVVLLLPLGIAGFSLAVRKARAEGNLAQY